MRRIIGAFVVLVVSLAFAGPAAAEFTENDIGCSGAAVVTGGDGSTAVIDAEDDEVTVPKDGSAEWDGSIATVTHNHVGAINLEVGPIDVELGSWESENDGDESTRSGTKDLSSSLVDVPPGTYDVTGFHQGDEGRCAGGVTVQVAGSIFGSPISAGSVAVAALAAIAFAFALLRGRPILAAFAGLVLGAFGALDLVFAGAISSGSILLVVVPLALLVIGAVLALARLRGLRGPIPPPGVPA